MKAGAKISRRAFAKSMALAPLLSRPAEYRRFRDELTRAVIHQLTSHPSINHPTYFLTSSFTPDGKHVIL